jgi:subtilase family serine protease
LKQRSALVAKWLKRAWRGVLPLLLPTLLVALALAVTHLDPRLPQQVVGPFALAPLAPADADPPLPAPAPGQVVNGQYLFTPDELRFAYGVSRLLLKGYTGAGQTVVVVDCYGNPDLLTDVATFDQRYGLPTADVEQLAPLGAVPFDPHDALMSFWARETDEDVEVIHAIAPGARIVVLTSPVPENQGTSGLPEFLQLEEYAVNAHLGAIVSQSWGASEVTLGDSAGRAEVARWDAFYQQATLRQGVSFFASSGDHGATDYGNLSLTAMSSTRTVNFPADDPWVTAVGGTTLGRNGEAFAETGWSESGGGLSAFFATPSYQQGLPPSVQDSLANRRGVPDIAAVADHAAGLGIYVRGEWRAAWGTSEGAPLWAALTAIANQMADRPLGFLNPGLYQLAQGERYSRDFHDITAGNNTFDGWGVHVAGFAASAGWDAVTGLGTPNAEHLLPDLIAASPPTMRQRTD